ncbi:hypothetical protein QEN19_000655 [Hanseniaspora menglaensis]
MSIVQSLNSDSSMNLSSSDYEDVFEDISADTTEKYHQIMNSSKTLLDKAEVDKIINEIKIDKNIILNKSKHMDYLFYFLLSNKKLPTQFNQLEASNPWILYWLINSYKVMKELEINEKTSPMPKDEIDAVLKRETILKLSKFQQDNGKGGFAGGFNQMPHLATNYSSILALCLTGNLKKVDSSKITKWFDSLVVSLNDHSCKLKTSQPCGETDSRSIYCYLVAAKLLNIDIPLILLERLWDHVSDLQSDFEGGLNGALKTDESHGGYTYCTLSSIVILLELLADKKPETFKEKKLHDVINIDCFLQWLSLRQDYINGGLNGRSNKLVDGCYAFWIGACGVILKIYGYINPIDMPRLKEYILFYCQDNDKELPGLRDKPGKNSDFYHTNYILMGLSLCEYNEQFSIGEGGSLDVNYREHESDINKDVHPVNPLYGVPIYVLQSKK